MPLRHALCLFPILTLLPYFPRTFNVSKGYYAQISFDIEVEGPPTYYKQPFPCVRSPPLYPRASAPKLRTMGLPYPTSLGFTLQLHREESRFLSMKDIFSNCPLPFFDVAPCVEVNTGPPMDFPFTPPLIPGLPLRHPLELTTCVDSFPCTILFLVFFCIMGFLKI